MAFSSSEGKLAFKDWLLHIGKPLGFTRFLDVGCGAGLYGDLIREVFGMDVQVEAVEAFREYIFRFSLVTKYNAIICRDIREVCKEVETYDLITMGDVIEHLPKRDAIDVVNTLLPKCRFLWAALPVKIERPWSTGYAQGACEWEENPFNEHKHEWNGEEIVQEFKPLFLMPFVQTGTFLIEGGIR